MIAPAASLHADVEVIDRALEPFGAPHVNEYPGLRWMQRTLEQRRAHIMGNIAEVEQSTLTLRLRTATGASAVQARMVATLLYALQRELYAAADDVEWPPDLPEQRREDALTLEVEAVRSGEGPWSATVQRPSGPLSAQPPTAAGERLAFDAAVDSMLDRFVAGDSGDLGVLVADEGLSVELVTAPATGDGRTIALDRHTAPGARAADGSD